MMAEPISLAAAKRQKNKGGSADEVSDAPCPITPLGHVDGKFWFLNIIGEKRGLTARQMGSRADITALFLGDMTWLEERFKAFTPEGQPAGFKLARAMEYLMDVCRRAGMYGEHIIVRKPGVWAGENGLPIVHCGDALFFDGEKMPAGQKVAGQIFAAAAREIYPAREAASAEIARRFEEDVRTLWNFRDAGAEIIVLGLVGQAYYAGALGWRANGFISGASNAGKSHLLKLMQALTPLNHFSTDTTKAGIEGAISGRAVPSFIDESSDRSDGMGGQVLLDVVLSASSGDGTKGHRGTADGSVRVIEMVGSVIMASVNPPAMQPQHRSRFAMIELIKPAGGADNLVPMQAAEALAKKEAPRLFARALAGFPRYRTALAEFRHALGRVGCVAREMDNVGAILAGYWVLTQDELPNEFESFDLVERIGAYIRGAEEMAQDDAPRAVIAMLLSRVVKLDRSTDEDSIAKMLRVCFGSIYGDTAQREQYVRVLARWGIRPVRQDELMSSKGKVIPRLGDGHGIWIDDRWQPLKGIFAGTPYDGNRWIMELRRLPSAKKARENVRVSELPPGKAIWLLWEDINGPPEDE